MRNVKMKNELRMSRGDGGGGRYSSKGNITWQQRKALIRKFYVVE